MPDTLVTARPPKRTLGPGEHGADDDGGDEHEQGAR